MFGKENFKFNKSSATEEQEINPQEILLLAEKESESILIRPEDKNPEGALLVFPGGPVSNLPEEYWKIARTPSFKKWFGNSEVIDENGEPAVLCHTTQKPLEGFDSFNTNKRDLPTLDIQAHYFSSGNYGAGENKVFVFVNAKIKRVYKHEDIIGLDQVKKRKIKAEGFDAVAFSFQDAKKELDDIKEIDRKMTNPIGINEKIFYGFYNLKKFLSGQKHHNSEKSLLRVKTKSEHLEKVKEDAKSPFFELAVLESEQIMIIKKENTK